jgi:hypothetical protein
MAASSLPRGSEVHNTYGELGNADLLTKYGFALRQNPFSAVVLSKTSVLRAAEKLIGERELRLRTRMLRKERYNDLAHFQCFTSCTAQPSLRVQNAFGACPSGGLLCHTMISMLTGSVSSAVSFLMRSQSPLRCCLAAA